MSTDNREDYLINILRLTDGIGVVKTTELAAYMNVSPASVTEMLKVLQKEGLVNYEKYKGVSLTEKGINDARALRRKHHIMERFLNEVLDIDHKQAHDEACAVEHSISEDTANKMCRMIGTRVDKDCVTCTNPCKDAGVILPDCVNILSMDVGDHGVISHIASNDESMIRKLISMGFVPGREISFTSKISDEGARIVKIGYTSIALDKSMASSVYVNKE